LKFVVNRLVVPDNGVDVLIWLVSGVGERMDRGGHPAGHHPVARGRSSYREHQSDARGDVHGWRGVNGCSVAGICVWQDLTALPSIWTVQAPYGPQRQVNKLDQMLD